MPWKFSTGTNRAWDGVKTEQPEAFGATDDTYMTHKAGSSNRRANDRCSICLAFRFIQNFRPDVSPKFHPGNMKTNPGIKPTGSGRESQLCSNNLGSQTNIQSTASD